LDFIKNYIPGRLRLDRKFLFELLASGVFAAIGVYELGLNPELYGLVLIAVPVVGLGFTYLRVVSDSRTTRIVSIIVVAAILGLWSKSFALAIAFFLMLEGATRKDCIRRYEDARWMQVAETEDSINTAKEIISHHTLFRALPEQLRTSLTEKCSTVELEPDGVLIRQGEFNSYLYLIAKGSVDIIRDGEKVASMTAGDLVGEISAIGLSLPVADVVATNELLAFAFPIDEVNRVASENKAFARQLYEIGMRRLQPKGKPR